MTSVLAGVIFLKVPLKIIYLSCSKIEQRSFSEQWRDSTIYL